MPILNFYLLQFVTENRQKDANCTFFWDKIAYFGTKGYFCCGKLNQCEKKFFDFILFVVFAVLAMQLSTEL